MKRYRHYWWPERGRYFPSRVAVLDSAPPVLRKQGRPGSNAATRPAEWCLMTAELLRGEPRPARKTQGRGTYDMMNALSRLCRSRETTWVLIPNAVPMLDRCGFFDLLQSRRVTLCGEDWFTDRGRGTVGEDKARGVCVLNNPPTVVACRPAGAPGKWLILDTRNFGFELQVVDNGIVRNCEGYLHGILSVLRTLRSHSAASIRCTAASQAVSCLRADWPVSYLHCHTDERAARLERGCQLYGWCEAFRRGVIPGPVYHLDVRSMYAAICCEIAVPVSLRRYCDAEGSGEGCRPGNPGHCVGYVSVRCGRDDGPADNRGEGGNASDVVTSYFAGPELLRLHERGRIARWHAWAEYTCVPALSGFARSWLSVLADARQEGNQLVCQWLKRLLVSVVGKFGETGKRWVPVPAITERGPYAQFWGAGPDGRECLYRNVAHWTQRQEVHGESYHSIPAITAFVIAAGRCQLSDYLDIAGRSNVWYVDTDALLCNREAYNALVQRGTVREGEVGHLRTVGVHDRCVIHDRRHYELDGAVKCSGVPRGRIEAGETRQDYWQGPSAGEGIYRPVWARSGGK